MASGGRSRTSASWRSARSTRPMPRSASPGSRPHADLDRTLARVQNDLFDLGADLAVPPRGGEKGKSRLRVAEAQVEAARGGDRSLQCGAGAAHLVRAARRHAGGGGTSSCPDRDAARRAATRRARRPRAAQPGGDRLRQPALRPASSSRRALPMMAGRATCYGFPARTASATDIGRSSRSMTDESATPYPERPTSTWALIIAQLSSIFFFVRAAGLRRGRRTWRSRSSSASA